MGSLGIGYVDDVGLLILGDTVEDCVSKIRLIYPIIQRWPLRRVSIFDLEKFQLVHFIPTSRSNIISLRVGNVTYKVTDSLKYLRVYLD